MVSLGLLPKHLFSCQVIIYLLWFAAIFQNYATGEVVHMSMDVDIGVPGDVTAAAMKYESIVGVSLENCVDHCKRRSFCSYISYARNAHVCSIIKHVNQSQTATFRKRAGYVLGKKAEWDMTAYADCGICTINETCVRDGASASCNNTACGSPEIPDNAILQGNMYNIGSRLLLRCTDDRWSPQGDQVQITCLSSGLWTSTDFSCLPETTTTTTTTTPPPFSCVDFDSSYRTVMLEDNTTVTYRLVDEPRISKGDASQICKNDGGELIKIVTTARMNFVLQLTACQGMPSNDIWVDGVKRQNENVWDTTDEDIVPMTYDFWDNGKPDALSTQHCIRLIRGAGFKFDNQVCGNSYSYMCEKF